MKGDSEFDFVLSIVVSILSIIAFGVGLMVWLEEHSYERQTLEKKKQPERSQRKRKTSKRCHQQCEQSYYTPELEQIRARMSSELRGIRYEGQGHEQRRYGWDDDDFGVSRRPRGNYDD